MLQDAYTMAKENKPLDEIVKEVYRLIEEIGDKGLSAVQDQNSIEKKSDIDPEYEEFMQILVPLVETGIIIENPQANSRELTYELNPKLKVLIKQTMQEN